ncbi:MAG: dTMP kinase [Thermotogota bacterium]|nr:dTMP kinase [Thermotogota bacterium]MDK2865311.1 dTMP kinase [Thermotogota bacterium]
MEAMKISYSWEGGSMMTNGKLITFEGIDGCGKSTQVQMLSDHLSSLGYSVVVVREPGGTDVGEAIRDILLSVELSPCPETELLLYLASRAQLTRQIIFPALNEGKVVIADRFADSSTVYQGYARGIGMETVKKLNAFATMDLVPNITFILDIPEEIAAERMKLKSKDRLEKEGTDFLKKAREGYLILAREEPERFVVVNASRSPDVIFEEILLILKEKRVIQF